MRFEEEVETNFEELSSDKSGHMRRAFSQGRHAEMLEGWISKLIAMAMFLDVSCRYFFKKTCMFLTIIAS